MPTKTFLGDDSGTATAPAPKRGVNAIQPDDGQRVLQNCLRQLDKLNADWRAWVIRAISALPTKKSQVELFPTGNGESH